MTLITYKPNRSIYNDVNMLLDQFWNFDYIYNNIENNNSDFNIIDNKDAYIVTADLPGIDKKDLDIFLSDDTLTISGERKTSKVNEDQISTYSNIKYGKFEKYLYLPEDVNKNKITATMTNGVLCLDIPKSKKVSSESKKIAIK